MKAESNIMPSAAFKVEKRGLLADIIFFENVTETIREEEKMYEYDSYILTVDNRDCLEEAIAENYEAWIAEAKAKEQPEPYEPSLNELNRADIEYIAMMTGVDL